jgi:hypothetical protein
MHQQMTRATQWDDIAFVHTAPPRVLLIEMMGVTPVLPAMVTLERAYPRKEGHLRGNALTVLMEPPCDDR